jgi:hypothetical protein
MNHQPLDIFIRALPCITDQAGLSFKGDDVRKILSGAQTSTRRLAAHRSSAWFPGASLWVQETWGYEGDPKQAPDLRQLRYLATDPQQNRRPRGGWLHPRNMPRWASRITLALSEVRAEHLQSMTTEDARAEGFPSIDEYAHRWNNHHPAVIWSDNPLVIALRFTATVRR